MFSSWSIEHNATYYQRYHVPSDKAFVRPTDFIYLFEIFSQQLSFFIPRYLKLHENEKNAPKTSVAMFAERVLLESL